MASGPVEFEVEVTEAPAPEDVATFDAGLEAFNQGISLARDRTKVPLAVLLRRDGRVVGGASGDTHYGWLYLDLLWVEEPLRGAGWGRRLVERLESEAVVRRARATPGWTPTGSRPRLLRAPGLRGVRPPRGFPARLDAPFPLEADRMMTRPSSSTRGPQVLPDFDNDCQNGGPAR